MTTFEDIALDEAMSQIYSIIDSGMEDEAIEDELYERGLVESYDDATLLILKRHKFLEKLQTQEKHKGKQEELNVERLTFEDIFLEKDTLDER